jgi:hypothetical protein
VAMRRCATRRFMENPRPISGDSLMFSEPAR